MAVYTSEGRVMQCGHPCECGCGGRFAKYFRNGKYWSGLAHFKKAERILKDAAAKKEQERLETIQKLREEKAELKKLDEEARLAKVKADADAAVVEAERAATEAADAAKKAEAAAKKAEAAADLKSISETGQLAPAPNEAEKGMVETVAEELTTKEVAETGKL